MKSASAVTTTRPSIDDWSAAFSVLVTSRPGRAVVDAEFYAVGSKEREQGNGNRAQLHRAEDRRVKRPRRLEHDRDAIAGRHALGGEVVGEPRRRIRQLAKTQDLIASVGMGDDDGRVRLAGMPVDAFVRDVQTLAIAVEQLPQLGGGKMRLGIRKARVLRQAGHRQTMAKGFGLYNSVRSCICTIQCLASRIPKPLRGCGPYRPSRAPSPFSACSAGAGHQWV